MVRRLNRLPCFEPSKYYLDPAHHYDDKCIAPAGHDSQCRIKIDPSTVKELTAFFFASYDPSERHRLLREIVLARCCGRWHEWKLAGRKDVLAEVCSRYEDTIKALSDIVLLDDNDCDPLCVNKKPHTSLAQCCRAQSRGSGRNSSHLDPYHGIEALTNVFVLYSSCRFGDVESRLMAPVTDRRDGPGWVYGFAWPDRPGFIKIGSCKSCPTTRLLAWLECHPKATLIHAIAVPFRKRAEQLIHRELSRQRHKMISCQQCSRTHLEWFKVSVEKARSVLDSWEELFKRWSPYLKDGNVAPEWRIRLGRTKHDLTAKRLLGICTAERATERSIKPTNILRKTKDEPLVAAPISEKRAIKLEQSRTAKASSTCSIDWDMVMVYFYDFWRLS